MDSQQDPMQYLQQISSSSPNPSPDTSFSVSPTKKSKDRKWLVIAGIVLAIVLIIIWITSIILQRNSKQDGQNTDSQTFTQAAENEAEITLSCIKELDQVTLSSHGEPAPQYGEKRLFMSYHGDTLNSISGYTGLVFATSEQVAQAKITEENVFSTRYEKIFGQTYNSQEPPLNSTFKQNGTVLETYYDNDGAEIDSSLAIFFNLPNDSETSANNLEQYFNKQGYQCLNLNLSGAK